jgi:hypothetical protein
MSVCAKQHPDFVLRLRHVTLIERKHVIPEPVARSEHLEKRLGRNHHEAIARLAENTAHGPRNADHFERPSFK